MFAFASCRFPPRNQRSGSVHSFTLSRAMCLRSTPGLASTHSAANTFRQFGVLREWPIDARFALLMTACKSLRYHSRSERCSRENHTQATYHSCTDVRSGSCAAESRARARRVLGGRQHRDGGPGPVWRRCWWWCGRACLTSYSVRGPSHRGQRCRWVLEGPERAK
jgi:hypothetical protein